MSLYIAVVIIYSGIYIVQFYLELSFHVSQVLFLLTRFRCSNKEGTKLGIGLVNKKEKQPVNQKDGKNFGEWHN